MKDYMVRAIAANDQVRAFAATTRNMVETAREAHNTSPVATAALGRLLTAGAMMGSMMKNEKDVLTIQINCDGPIQGLTVTADMNGNVKGYVENPNVMLPPSKKGKLDVANALGLGVMNVIKDMGLKEPYVGQTILVTSEIAEDLTYYFATSEQVPSSVALGVLMNRDFTNYFATSEQVPSSVGLGVLMEKDNTVKQAGGFIIQVMPFVQDEVVAKLEENIANVESVTSMLDKGYTPEQILETILDGFDIEYTDKMPAQFHCNCSKERVEKALISIGKKDIQEMIDDGKDIEMHCHFCNTSYNFTVEELKEILKKSR